MQVPFNIEFHLDYKRTVLGDFTRTHPAPSYSKPVGRCQPTVFGACINVPVGSHVYSCDEAHTFGVQILIVDRHVIIMNASTIDA